MNLSESMAGAQERFIAAFREAQEQLIEDVKPLRRARSKAIERAVKLETGKHRSDLTYAAEREYQKKVNVPRSEFGKRCAMARREYFRKLDSVMDNWRGE